jgi:hypothetical protein
VLLEILEARSGASFVKGSRPRGVERRGLAVLRDSSRIIIRNPEIPVVDLRSREESSSHVRSFPASRKAT